MEEWKTLKVQKISKSLTCLLASAQEFSGPSGRIDLVHWCHLQCGVGRSFTKRCAGICVMAW